MGNPDIWLPVGVCLLTCALAGMGVYVTLYPPEGKARTSWICAFAFATVAGCGLVWWQSVRSVDAQNTLQAQLNRIEKNKPVINVVAPSVDVSKQIAELKAQMGTLKAADSSNQLSSLSNQRLEEMTNQTMNSLFEYHTEWSRAGSEIGRALQTRLQHTSSKEEEQAERQKAAVSFASLDTETRKGLKGELKPVFALLAEIYENRLDFYQKKKTQLEYQEVEDISKKVKSGNYDLSILMQLAYKLSEFDNLLKTNLKP
jgi:hypothetical protein